MGTDYGVRRETAMNILVFMNAEEDGLGTIGDYCGETGVDPAVARLYADEPVPDNPEAYRQTVSAFLPGLRRATQNRSFAKSRLRQQG